MRTEEEKTKRREAYKVGLGSFKDDVHRLEKAIAYLNGHKREFAPEVAI